MRIASFLAVMVCAVQAQASFHLCKVSEIFPGSAANPDAVFIELEETSTEPSVGGKVVTIFAADGTTVLSTATIGAVGSVPDGGTVLLATDEAIALFPGATRDGDLEPSGATVIDLAGGKACFNSSTDCVAWGAYTGSSSGVGEPFSPNGLALGHTFARIRGASGPLDTGSSAMDWEFIDDVPTPQGDADSDPGVAAVTSCGNGVEEGIEGCDDGNATSGDGCTACQVDVCGDGDVQGDEECDDGHFNDTDDCSATCTDIGGDPAAECGDGTVDAGEDCDDGNNTAGDGCSASCAEEDDGADDEAASDDDGGGGCAAAGGVEWTLLGLAGLLRRRHRA